MWNRSSTTMSWTLSLMSCCLSLSGCEQVGMPLPISTEELCQLGAYVSIAVVSADADGGGGGGGPKVGDVCPECRGVGRVGDGTIMMKCEACNGTGRVQAGQATCDETIDEAAARYGELMDCVGTQKKDDPPRLEEGVLYKIDGQLFQREWRDGRYHYVPAVPAR